MPWLAAAAVAAPIIGGAIGNAQSSGDRADARRQQELALQELMRLNSPEISSMELNLDQYGSAGDLNATLAGLAQQGNTGMSGIQTDPRLQQAQMDVLNRLQSINESGGMDDIMKAQMFDSRNNAAAEAASQNAAIREEMARRGQSGGGLEMLNRQMANDSALNRMAATDMQSNAQAQQRALDALMAQGNMAGNMDQAQYSRQADAAKAQDLINQFNTSNRNQNNQFNAGVQNQSNQFNLTNRQNLINANTDLKNKQQQYNKELIQQDFNNKKDIAGLKSGAYNQGAKNAQDRANQTAQMWAGIGSGIGKGLSGFSK